MAKSIHSYTDAEYEDYEDDEWPWLRQKKDDDQSYDFFPHWFPDSTKDKWETYLASLFPAQGFATPDMPELNRSRSHYVFVYGTLKRNGGNNKYLGPSVYLGRAWTKVRCLKMYTDKLNCPVVFFTSQSDGHAIQGEVYLCTPTVIRELDLLEANGEYYKRRAILVETEDGRDLKAFMYFGLKEQFSEKELTKCSLFTRKKTNKTYYSYTPNYTLKGIERVNGHASL